MDSHPLKIPWLGFRLVSIGNPMAQYLVPEETRMNIHETLLATKRNSILWMAKTRFNPSQTFFFSFDNCFVMHWLRSGNVYDYLISLVPNITRKVSDLNPRIWVEQFSPVKLGHGIMLSLKQGVFWQSLSLRSEFAKIRFEAALDHFDQWPIGHIQRLKGNLTMLYYVILLYCYIIYHIKFKVWYVILQY